MATTSSTYFGLTKVREMSPEAQDWAVTDSNVEVMSLLLKAFEQHRHNASTALNFPGYYDRPASPTVTPQGTPGAVAYYYYIVARGTINQESFTGSTQTGATTLTGTNFNRVSWVAVPGATGYDVIRLSGGATQGRIATNLSTGTTQFDDIGGAATDYVPTRQPTLTLQTGGILPPGNQITVRTSYRDALGLETAASEPSSIDLPSAATRPLTPALISVQTAASALSGGTYIYALTKKKDEGETTISDVLPVTIAYDSTYSVTLSFNAINTYTDGTEALNIYRSSGLDQSFQLVTTVTNSSTNQFTDTNTISAQNVNVQPPTVNTFDANKKIRISWSAITHPAEAKYLRIYVTQQTGLWATNHLLQEFDLTTSPPNFVDYLGSESLLPGWPKDVSQVPAGAPKVNLTTEATGAPVLTANMDFSGFQANNFRLENRAGAPGTPQNGWMYYDTSTNNVRAYINGTWVNWGTTVSSAYTHPAEEGGGHIAGNIKFAAGSGVTAKTIFDRIADPSTGARKQVGRFNKSAGATSNPTTTSTTPVLIPEMQVTGVLPDFNTQWIEILFDGHFIVSNLGSNISVALDVNGLLLEETVRSATAVSQNQNISMHSHLYAQMGNTATAWTISVLWWTSSGTLTAVSTRRSLVSEIKF